MPKTKTEGNPCPHGSPQEWFSHEKPAFETSKLKTEVLGCELSLHSLFVGIDPEV